MKILVTGGAGFIGSHLCEALANNKKYQIWSLDNYSTGSVNNHIPGVTYIRGNTANIDELINFSPDIIYHLGEYSRVEQSFDDISTVWNYNKQGTFSVLQFSRKHASKIVYAGSSTKFGDGGLGRFQSPYGWTKASNTELVENYGKWFDLPYAIVYFYNAYGKREISTGKYATLIGLFSEKMKNVEPLCIVSPGTQKRNFTHVNDIVSGLILVGENGYGDEFGIGSHDAFSIIEVAQMFGGKIKMLEERRGNRMCADVITEKTKKLGWDASYKLVDYIEVLRANKWQAPK
ncbi:NAD-dependent epimerase/dehydratase family protein [Candidatus Methylopumilus planktonicus]|uniref:NAD-dependent epimerase/dehydratase family protein n=1 Tax=Candidatus Methylopumilus planktonicus TaxID=1581557 RepID=UPI00111EB7C3|nr:NAD-dependent epimerase/dehydratase family protein [Candidatus Methylopumilus planktonicus]QDD00465.1 NAD-dependent epimerase/dehydratase family protein [Candidatus Methylopumilus planktonicus]